MKDVFGKLEGLLQYIYTENIITYTSYLTKRITATLFI